MVEHFVYTEKVIGSSPILLNIMLLNFLNIHNYQFGFQLANSPIMEGIISFHHDLFFFLVFILFFVIYLLTKCIIDYNSNNKNVQIITHASNLEIIWTLIPAVILIFIAMPSFSLLYSMDELVNPLLTIKIIGHQWYWSYEYPSLTFINYKALQNNESSWGDFVNKNKEVLTPSSDLLDLVKNVDFSWQSIKSDLTLEGDLKKPIFNDSKIINEFNNNSGKSLNLNKMLLNLEDSSKHTKLDFFKIPQSITIEEALSLKNVKKEPYVLPLVKSIKLPTYDIEEQASNYLKTNDISIDISKTPMSKSYIIKQRMLNYLHMHDVPLLEESIKTPIIKETAQKEDSNVEEVKIEENSNKKENITEEVLKEEVTPKKEISHIPFLEDAKNSLKPIKEVTLPVESPVKVINNKLGNIQIEGELVKGYLEYNMYNVPLDIFTYAFVRPHNSILHHTATVFYEGSQFTPKELSLMKKSTKYDSYMINKYSDIYKDLRLLQVDNKLYLPTKANIRFIITSADVLHSWAVPSLGIKLDACPGRLNQTSTFINRSGIFYGQCSEICGVNHGFMPIAIGAVDLFLDFNSKMTKYFDNAWLYSYTYDYFMYLINAKFNN